MLQAWLDMLAKVGNGGVGRLHGLPPRLVIARILLVQSETDVRVRFNIDSSVNAPLLGHKSCKTPPMHKAGQQYG